MANNKNDRIKVAGYARRIFFNDNIEYRNFSPDLVGLQFTSDGGTALFTNGNFTITTNLDPKPNVIFTQGTKSQLYDLDDVVLVCRRHHIPVYHKRRKGEAINIYLTEKLYEFIKKDKSKIVQQALEEYIQKQEHLKTEIKLELVETVKESVPECYWGAND